MKKLFIISGLFLCLSSCAFCQSTQDIKEQAFALYATKNYSEAFNLLDNLSADEKTEDIFLILANIAESNNDDNLAIQNLNKALDKNPSYYKAYYNLGCILAKKNSYPLAIDNFKLAIKYNKTNVSSYYNLAYSEIKIKDYKNAKKNLIKALELDPLNKDCLYNLAYCYKQLGKEKQAIKILDSYNRLSDI